MWSKIKFLSDHFISDHSFLCSLLSSSDYYYLKKKDPLDSVKEKVKAEKGSIMMKILSIK